MYFDLADRGFDTPTIESAMSWREQILLALFVHLLAAVLVLLVPRLPFMQDAAARRAERLAEMVEEERLALLQAQEEPEFIFVQPLIDMPAPEPPPEADLSDLDRVAQSVLPAETPVNDLPSAEGNSLEFVAAEDPSDGLDPVAESGAELETAEVALAEPVDGVDDGSADAPEREAPEAAPGDGGVPVNPFLADRGETVRETPPTARSGTLLKQALRRLDGVARSRMFDNPIGRTDQYGPEILFDTKGVDFGSWIRRFRALIYRNWDIPYAIWSMSGHVVLTFNIHRDGTITDLLVVEPSLVDGFTNSAHNAMSQSNPTPALPEEYPDDTVFFTVVFYFNERPPSR